MFDTRLDIFGCLRLTRHVTAFSLSLLRLCVRNSLYCNGIFKLLSLNPLARSHCRWGWDLSFAGDSHVRNQGTLVFVWRRIYLLVAGRTARTKRPLLPCLHKELCTTKETAIGVSPHCFQVRITVCVTTRSVVSSRQYIVLVLRPYHFIRL